MHGYNRRVAVQRTSTIRAKSVAALLAAASLSACSTVGYYGHLAHGEYALLSARRPIERVLADPSVDEALKQRLQLAEQARTFASARLGLPRNASYTEYADLHRPYATWNVFAAAEFSVSALEHCYLLVGCLAYRGYFDRKLADDEATRLRAQGYETWVAGSVAYSTLGWFADPILNTMLRWDDDELAGTIFHELAHQRLFVKGDTEFNESFASFVQREGQREWRLANALPPRLADEDTRSDEFEQLVLDTRERLRALYATPLGADTMRTRKHEEFERLRTDYFSLRDSRWHGFGVYDEWINGELNNAKLLPFGLYHRWVPAFAALFAQSRDWTVFYDAASKIARLESDARHATLTKLQTDSEADPRAER
jgi:predicted aminopeptidase